VALAFLTAHGLVRLAKWLHQAGSWGTEHEPMMGRRLNHDLMGFNSGLMVV